MDKVKIFNLRTLEFEDYDEKSMYYLPHLMILTDELRPDKKKVVHLIDRKYVGEEVLPLNNSENEEYDDIARDKFLYNDYEFLFFLEYFRNDKTLMIKLLAKINELKNKLNKL